MFRELTFVFPVIAFTFVVMGWIVVVFRRYLKRRDAIVSAWPVDAHDHSAVSASVHDHHSRAA